MDCGGEDGFLKLGPIKLPDFPISMLNLSAAQCADACLRNCSCTAYSYANVSLEPSPRCLQWAGNLLDLADNFTSSGQDLYIRLSRDELGGYQLVEILLIYYYYYFFASSSHLL